VRLITCDEPHCQVLTGILSNVVTPSSDDLKKLIRSSKPAFVATGVTDDPHSTFRVIHNGRGAWMIERPGRSELLSGGRTILQTGQVVDVIDIPVAVNNDVKSALDGERLAYLEDGVLEVVGSTTVAGRTCLKVRAWGLKRGEERPFDLSVDTETGAILRMEGPSGALFEVTDFCVGHPPADIR
jgi:hypothetical protein